LGFGVWDLGFGIYLCVQVIPPSAVANVRPSAVTTVAVRASVAVTPDRSTASGKVTRCQVWRSVERNILPARPTIQQTSADGADPAVIWPAMSAGGADHAGPHGFAAKATRACSCPEAAPCRPASSRFSAAAGVGAADRTDTASLRVLGACCAASFAAAGAAAGAAASAARARSCSVGVARVSRGAAGSVRGGGVLGGCAFLGGCASCFCNETEDEGLTATFVGWGTATQIATAVAAAAAGTAHASHHLGLRSGSGAGTAARVRPMAPTSA